MKKLFSLLIISLAIFFTSCSDESNNEKYRSEPPTFSDITVKPLNGNDSQIHVGEKFLATAKQKKLGRLLNASTYSWTCNSNDIAHNFQKSVIYDDDTHNPTDTLIVTKAGSYTLTFTGKYNASGNTQIWAQKYGSDFSETFESGEGSANYVTGGLLYFKVTATKTIQVVE